jgi:hypothetical protein
MYGLWRCIHAQQSVWDMSFDRTRYIGDEDVMDPKSLAEERRLATRFALEMPMRYRALEEVTWRETRTENVGRSGVFFRDEPSLTLDTPIEMVLLLPVELGGEPGANSVCRGRIVRVEEATNRLAGMAATIESYLMEHGDPRRI